MKSNRNNGFDPNSKRAFALGLKVCMDEPVPAEEVRWLLEVASFAVDETGRVANWQCQLEDILDSLRSRVDDMQDGVKVSPELLQQQLDRLAVVVQDMAT